MCCSVVSYSVVMLVAVLFSQKQEAQDESKLELKALSRVIDCRVAGKANKVQFR